MKKFEKIYVGKGRLPQEGMEIVRVTLSVEDLNKLTYEFEGNKYVTLEIARMKQPDGFGRTHTAYGSVLQQEPQRKRSRRQTAK
jgi:hypothetical protein